MDFADETVYAGTRIILNLKQWLEETEIHEL